jgi:ubiquinone/menaquinone biosynthesis C-methylase UbiE
MNDVIRHYDLLVEENNDPVNDTLPLRQYMDKWDGHLFLEELQLELSKTVLEIGVGTGRLAIRTCGYCKELWGIDLSPKTVKRAGENLRCYTNVKLVCGDFMTYEFPKKFDVIYSSLTFMHVKEKEQAIAKAASLLTGRGRFVLSIDKSQAEYIEIGTRRIRIYPDKPEDITKFIGNAGMYPVKIYETEFAVIFVAVIR